MHTNIEALSCVDDLCRVISRLPVSSGMCARVSERGKKKLWKNTILVLKSEQKPNGGSHTRDFKIVRDRNGREKEQRRAVRGEDLCDGESEGVTPGP